MEELNVDKTMLSGMPGSVRLTFATSERTFGVDPDLDELRMMLGQMRDGSNAAFVAFECENAEERCVLFDKCDVFLLNV